MRSSASSLTTLSVVIPVYNSGQIFPELHRRVSDALRATVPSFELIAVLDGCRDNSFEVIQTARESDDRIKIVELSRNFGHQAAVTAGLAYASGDMVLIMDDDLEDPPELIPRFIEELRAGSDVVYGVRKGRKRSLLHRLLYTAFYRILGRLSDIPIPRDAGDFCIMSRRVVDILNSLPERDRFLRGLRAWTGFRQTGLEYERSGRFAGEPGYTMRKYLSLAVNGIISFSHRPLTFISVIGALIAAVSFILGLLFIILKFSGRIPDVPGWTSLAVLLLFLSGIQMVTTGVIGAYIARIFDEVKQRPSFVVGRTVGIDRKDGK
ncbi:MAG: glycosyltransferase family 2 protein [Nitrospirota bacterium]|nr:glycosyltransferase family 2 protein [Nitrospirota bacterium]